MSLINVSNLTFGYEDSFDNVFDNVSFSVDTNWKLGFVGRNGKGKTTFLNLLMGEYEYQGAITSSVEFEYFPYVVQNKNKNAIDIVEEIYPDYEFWELCRELNYLEFNEENLFKEFDILSYGEQTKVLLATLFLKPNKFLLIDEPTNHLDVEGRLLLAKYLKNKKGFILVSHDRFFLDSIIDHVLSINKSNIEVVNGNFTTWYTNKENQDKYEISENVKMKKDIERLKEAQRKTSDWSDKVESTKYGVRFGGLRPDTGYIGHKAAKMMKTSKNIEGRREDLIEEKSKLLKNIEEVEGLKISPIKHFNNELISIKNLSIIYDEKEICNEVNFNINYGDRIALKGKNGSGKTSIIKLILNQGINYSGEIIRASNLKISYVSQDTSYLSGSLKDFIYNNHIDETLFKAILRKLDFSRTQFEKEIESYSQGQKKKLLIAKSLCEQAHLYIWDEPLNYIDVISRMQIEELILTYNPTIIFVEHDKIFCEKVATKTIEITKK